MSRCIVCGRPLTDPESIRLGAGPICRPRLPPLPGRRPPRLADPATPLFNHRASYSLTIDGAFIVIIDDNQAGRSVTNDVDAVLGDLLAQGLDLTRYYIIYRDTMGTWDGIRADAGEDGRFIPLCQRSLPAAKERLLQLVEEGKVRPRQAPAPLASTATVAATLH